MHILGKYVEFLYGDKAPKTHLCVQKFHLLYITEKFSMAEKNLIFHKIFFL